MLGRRRGQDWAEDRERSRDLRQLRYLLGLVSPYRLQVAGALLALSVAAGTVLALGMGLRTLVDRGFAGGDTTLLDHAVLVLLAVVAVLALATFSRYYLVSWIGERVVADLRRRVFDHVIRLSPGFFETTRIGEIQSRITTDTTLLQSTVGTAIPIALRNALLLIGGSVLLVITSPKLTGLVFLVTPLVIVPIVVFGRRVRRLSRASQDRVAELAANVDESLHGIRTVQAFGHESIDAQRFAERAESAFATAVRRVAARATLTAIVIFLVFAAVSVILWIGGHDVLAGRLTGGELSAFVFYAIVVAGSAGAISEVVGDLQRAAGAVERLLDLLGTEPQVVAPPAPVPLPDPPIGRVSFQGVCFCYPSRLQKAVLQDFTLDVEPGEHVALVGPSGAGKTTVFQLLLRFYDPDEGTVSLDGVELRRADPAAVRARVGLVPQEPVIFAADAWDNIRYGRPEASDQAVRAAADAAGATEFLERLPDGLSAYLGERGVRLSGGQRQRIAIARALLRNPPVLLLDEATSALDAESERLVQRALEHLMADRTTIVIAHRLATVLKADRIVVVDQGRIVAQGSHSVLMRQDGLYARLARLQFDVANPEDAEGTVDLIADRA